MNPSHTARPEIYCRNSKTFLTVLLFNLLFVYTTAHADQTEYFLAKKVDDKEVKLCRHAVLADNPDSFNSFANSELNTFDLATDSKLDFNIAENIRSTSISSYTISKQRTTNKPQAVVMQKSGNQVTVPWLGYRSKAVSSSRGLLLTPENLSSLPSSTLDPVITTLPFPKTHKVSGQIRFNYVKRYPDIASSQGNSNYPQYADVATMNSSRPIRFTKITLQDDCGHYIPGMTDGNGHYSFEWTPVNCGVGKITVWSIVDNGARQAAVGYWKHGPVNNVGTELTAISSDYSVYSYESNFFVIAAKLSDYPDGVNFDLNVPLDITAAKAFFILDNAVTAQDYFRDIPGVSNGAGLPKLNIEYTVGLQPNNAPDNWDGGWAFYQPSKHPGFIHIPAEPNDFGWNAFAHMHEVGHYFQHHYLKNMDYGKIGEPLANVHALAIMGNHWFDKQSSFENIDVQANYKDGYFHGAEWAFCDGCTDLDYSYGWTQRLLWDLIDHNQNNEPEPLSLWTPSGSNIVTYFGNIDLDNGGGGHNHSTDADDHQLNEVLVNYLGGGASGNESLDYTDRGLNNVDLVDVLDGMLCKGYLSDSAAENLVNDVMDFGYDFGGPMTCDN